MKLRIRFWPRRVLTLAGRPDPAAVRVELLGGDVPATTTRLASAPGFMVLLVRYPTKGKAEVEPADMRPDALKTQCLICGAVPVLGRIEHFTTCGVVKPESELRCPYCNALGGNHSADCGSASAGRVLTEHPCAECHRQDWHRVGCSLWPYPSPDWLCPWTPNCDGSAACVNHGEPRCPGCGEIADGHGSSCTM